MLRKGLQIAFLLYASGSCARICGQSLPTVKAVKVSATITHVGNLFVYDYSVTNPMNNTDAVSGFSLDLAKATNSVVLSPSGLVNGDAFLQDSADAIKSLTIATPTIPVGVEAPAGWVASPSVTGTLEWIAAIDSGVIAQGQSIQGFQITSPGLPAIRAFAAKPDFDISSLGLIPPQNEADWTRYHNDLISVETQMVTKGLTVGPTAPPANFVPLDFLRYI